MNIFAKKINFDCICSYFSLIFTTEIGLCKRELLINGKFYGIYVIKSYFFTEIPFTFSVKSEALIYHINSIKNSLLVEDCRKMELQYIMTPRKSFYSVMFSLNIFNKLSFTPFDACMVAIISSSVSIFEKSISYPLYRINC